MQDKCSYYGHLALRTVGRETAAFLDRIGCNQDQTTPGFCQNTCTHRRLLPTARQSECWGPQSISDTCEGTRLYGSDPLLTPPWSVTSIQAGEHGQKAWDGVEIQATFWIKMVVKRPIDTYMHAYVQSWNVQTHRHAYTYTYLHTCTFMHTCICACMHTLHMHINTPEYMHVCTHIPAHIHTPEYTHLHAYTHTWIHMLMHTYTQTHTLL